MKRDLISIADFSRQELWDVLVLSAKLKKQRFSEALQGRSIGLIFQKPSTRTAVSFAVGVAQLGGQPLMLNTDVLQIKRGESPRDTGRVLSRYLDAIVMRANHHADIQELAGFASIPVINGLTDLEHPCQVLADLLTIMEHRHFKHPKELAGFKIAYLGDGNNVAQSLMLAAAILGMDLTIASPVGYEPRKEYIEKAVDLARMGKGKIEITNEPLKAAAGKDALYTDVWASMGQEAEVQKRKTVFAPFQLNETVLSHAKPKALAMHCLPAHRGEEITEGVLEGPQSVIFDQAENRLHIQKALLATLLAKGKKKK